MASSEFPSNVPSIENSSTEVPLLRFAFASALAINNAVASVDVDIVNPSASCICNSSKMIFLPSPTSQSSVS